MKPERMAALTDGVFAVILTIVVLELPVPHGADLHALAACGPILLAYAISFANVGLYWNNHHHMLQATERIDGRVLWANLFMLFWLSLVPWVIRWLDEARFAAMPTAAYGVVLGMAGIGYVATQRLIVAVNGRASTVARAIGRDRKGTASLTLYLAAVPLAFVAPWLSGLLYLGVSAMWLVPDRRIARALDRG